MVCQKYVCLSKYLLEHFGDLRGQFCRCQIPCNSTDLIFLALSRPESFQETVGLSIREFNALHLPDEVSEAIETGTIDTLPEKLEVWIRAKVQYLTGKPA